MPPPPTPTRAGANTGMGFETAAALLGRGATVVLACRTAAAATAAAERLQSRPKVASRLYPRPFGAPDQARGPKEERATAPGARRRAPFARGAE